MKTMNYIKIGIASSILSIAAGCTSFLEEDLKSSLAPDNTYTSSLGFEVGATGLYAIARSEYNTWGDNGAFMHNGACAYEVLQISTDLCRMGTVRDGSLVPFAEMTLNPSTLFVGSYWNWAYNLIASANELLIYSEKNDNWDYPTDKQLYQAEARFFRAYAYRTLVYLYGDVPWVETIQKPFLLSFSRDPKIEVLGNIIKDLEFAKTYLPDNPDNVKEGKLTTWAARHLLSEMYLLRGAEGDYKLAEENAQDVIDCPYYSLMKSRFGNAKNASGREIESWNLLYSQTLTDANVVTNLWDGLMSFDCYGKAVPAIASSWEHNEDSTVWTFHLRDDVDWVDCNGEVKEHITATDFLVGLEWVLNAAKNQANNTSMPNDTVVGAADYYEQTKAAGDAAADMTYEDMLAAGVGIEAPDDYTLVFTCKDPCPYFDTVAAYNSFYPVAPALLDELGIEGFRGCDNTR